MARLVLKIKKMKTKRDGYISVNVLATTENYTRHCSTWPACDVIRFQHEIFLYSGFFDIVEVGLVIFYVFSTLVHSPPSTKILDFVLY